MPTSMSKQWPICSITCCPTRNVSQSIANPPSAPVTRSIRGLTLMPLRIIAGQRGGFKLEAPHNRRTRPTSDRVRESVFNILGELVEGATAIDLFAGTGAMGLEALSRGASRAVLVEHDRETVQVIKRNLAHVRYEDRVEVIAGDAYRHARGLRFQPGDPPVILFLDPPYVEYERNWKKLRDLLHHLWINLPVDSAIVLEAGERLREGLLPEPSQWDLRRYGGTTIALAVKSQVDPSEPPSEEGETRPDQPEA